jgi:hypothetical protein
MTEQHHLLPRLWQTLWNPQGKVRRRLVMLWWCGWVLWAAGCFAAFTGKHTEGSIINLIAILLFLPLSIHQFVEICKQNKQFRRDMNDLHIKFIALDTLLEAELHRHELRAKQQQNLSLTKWDLSPTTERKPDGSE